MRIVGGRFRGHPLRAPKAGTRPTTDRTREAVFNLVGARLGLRGARVLDLFAGSGALGLEALSRGAVHAAFVEKRGETVRVIRANAEALGVAEGCAVHRADALRWLPKATEPFDLVLADPPYALPEMGRLPDLVLPLVAAGGLLVLEHDANTDFGNHPALVTSRAYGRTVVSLFQPA